MSRWLLGTEWHMQEFQPLRGWSHLSAQRCNSRWISNRLRRQWTVSLFWKPRVWRGEMFKIYISKNVSIRQILAVKAKGDDSKVPVQSSRNFSLFFQHGPHTHTFFSTWDTHTHTHFFQHETHTHTHLREGWTGTFESSPLASTNFGTVNGNFVRSLSSRRS